MNIIEGILQPLMDDTHFIAKFDSGNFPSLLICHFGHKLGKTCCKKNTILGREVCDPDPQHASQQNQKMLGFAAALTL